MIRGRLMKAPLRAFRTILPSVHGRGRNTGNHRHFNTAFRPPPSMGTNLPPNSPRGAHLPGGKVVEPRGRPLAQSDLMRPSPRGKFPSTAVSRMAYGPRVGPGYICRDITNSNVAYTPEYLAFGRRGGGHSISGARGGRGADRGRVREIPVHYN